MFWSQSQRDKRKECLSLFCICDLSMMETLLFLLSFCWYLPWKIKHGWWNKHTIDWLIDLKKKLFHSQSDNFVSVISVWWRPMQTTSKPLSTIARDKWLVSFQSLRGLADISYDAPCTTLMSLLGKMMFNVYIQLKTCVGYKSEHQKTLLQTRSGKPMSFFMRCFPNTWLNSWNRANRSW